MTGQAEYQRKENYLNTDLGQHLSAETQTWTLDPSGLDDNNSIIQQLPISWYFSSPTTNHLYFSFR